MYRSARGGAILIAIFLMLLVSITPTVTKAQNICPEANAMCTAKATKGTICTCIIASFTLAGACIAENVCQVVGAPGVDGKTIPLKELPFEVTGQLVSGADQVGATFFDKALGFMQKNPLLSTIAIGAGTQLISSMFSPSGSGSGSGSDPGGFNTAYCSSGNYYYTQTPPPGDPCAIVSPPDNTVLPVDGGADPINLDDLLNDDIDLDLDGCPDISTIFAGCADGEGEVDQGLDDNGCEQEPRCVPEDEAGEACGDGRCPIDHFCSALADGICIPDGRVDCGTFHCPRGSSCGENDTCNVDYTDRIDIDLTDGDGTDDKTKQLFPLPPGGLRGDLLTFGGGATIIAGNRGSGSDVTGFIGGPGASGLCQKRPWAKNFLSYIIPPAFFDNLCSLAGDPVGQIQGGAYGGTGTGGTRVIPGPSAPSAVPGVAPTGVQPEAKIRANPPSVNLGGRTTIFWTSRDVSSCEEWSSDGNFTGSSTSGGASTVALSGPVTFYIRCLGLDGKYVNSSVTVQIGI